MAYRAFCIDPSGALLDGPEADNCRNVHDFMVEKSANTMVFLSQLPHEKEDIAKAPHSCLSFCEDGNRWVADAQYLQHVPLARREGLPSVMFVPVIDLTAFRAVLRDKYKIPEEYHYLWTELVFPGQNPFCPV